MRILIALGGNALLRRREPLTAHNQRRNVRAAVRALAPIARGHELVIAHGNGPQVGLLALQGSAYPLDVLDAETEGMIGYLIEQELGNLLPAGRRCATLLTQIEVDPRDPAFSHPTKPIGPLYSEQEGRMLAGTRGWQVALDGTGYRRVVASPRPRRILELEVIRLLVEQGVTVICAGGGGIPVVQRRDGSLMGVEAVIDKDLAASLLARELGADHLLLLTDVDAVYDGWRNPGARAMRRVDPAALADFEFAAGSMGPKVEAAVEFARYGGTAAIGRLEDAAEVLAGAAGTRIDPGGEGILWRD